MSQSYDPTSDEPTRQQSKRLFAWWLEVVRHVHWVPFSLSCWSFWAQMTYRVPGQMLVVVLPWVNAALSFWSLAWWMGALLLKLPSAGTFQRALLQVWGGACAIIALFAVYGAVIFVNGRFDRSELVERTSVVQDIKGVETELAYVVPPWIELHAWRGRGTVYLPLRGRERDAFWAGQPVVVQMRNGALGIPWVARIERDAEQQAKQILEFVPASAWAWKNLVDDYLDRTRWDEGKTALRRYLEHYPNDYIFARGCAVSLVLAHRSADAIEVMEPFLSRRPSYELYNILGFEYHKLGQRDRAIELLTASISLDPDSFDAYYHLGYVYKAMGKVPEAIAMFEEVLKRRSDFPEITAQLDQLRKLVSSHSSS